MQPDLVSSNVVLIAAQFNPSLITPLWLTKFGIVREEELQPEGIYTPAIVQFRTAVLELTALPDRVTVGFLSFQLHKRAIEQVKKLVKIVPHTPYIALGCNFLFRVAAPSPERLAELSHERFYTPSAGIFDAVPAEGRMLGGSAYWLLDQGRGRGRVEVKPEGTHFLLSFNFHFDVKESAEPAVVICTTLDHFDDYLRSANEIALTMSGA